MIARVAEIIAKPGKTEELCQLLEQKVTPLVKRRPGFVEKITLTLGGESRFVLVISFWNSIEDADSHHRQLFPKIVRMMEPFVEKGPSVRMFELRVSTGPFQEHTRASLGQFASA